MNRNGHEQKRGEQKRGEQKRGHPEYSCRTLSFGGGKAEVMLRPSTPRTCQKCGSTNTAAVEWRIPAVSRSARRANDEGVTVLVGGYRRPETAPEWVCLACQPGWLTVHQIAMEVEKLQVALENRLAAGQFEAAFELRDRREALQQQLGIALAPLVGQN